MFAFSGKKESSIAPFKSWFEYSRGIEFYPDVLFQNLKLCDSLILASHVVISDISDNYLFLILSKFI